MCMVPTAATDPTVLRPKAHSVSVLGANALVLAVVLASQARAQGSLTTGGASAPGTLPNLGYSNLPGAPLGTPAPPLTYGADVGVGETDNVTLSSTNKVSQTMAIADLDFAVNEQRRLLTAQAKGDFSFLDYLQGAYGSQTIGRFDGTGAFAILPEHVFWVAQDSYGQTALDPYTQVTPNNLQNVNYFATGPTFMTRFGGVNFTTLDLRYSRAQFSGSPFDSNRGSAALAVGREISAVASVSLNAAAEKVLFTDTQVNTNFLRTSAYARYQLQGARTGAEIDLGATKIDNSAATIVTPPVVLAPPLPPVPGTSVYTPAHSNTGALAKIQLSRLISPSMKVTLGGGRELTDASSSFSTLQSGSIGILGAATAIQSTAPYTSTFGSAGFTYSRSRTTIDLTGRYEKDVYFGSNDIFDLTREGAELTVQRRLSRAFTGQIIGRYYKYDYPNGASLVVPGTNGSTDYADSVIGGALAWRHGHALEIRLRVDHDIHDVRNGGDSGYHDSRVFLTVGYRPASAPSPEEPIEAP